MADVVAVEGDGGEAGVGPEELAAGDGGGAEGGVGGDLAEEGVGDLLRELGAEGELFDGELVEVGVGDAEAGEFGAEVAGFEAPVGGEGFLEGDVPLLGVAAAVGTLHAEDALAEAGIGVDGLGGDGGAVGEDEGGVDVVEGLLAEGLNEGEQGRREGGGDAGLLDPSDAVAAAEDERIGGFEGEAQAGGDVFLFEISGGGRGSVGAELVEFLGGEIEDGSAVVDDGGGEIQGVAGAEVDGEPVGEAPIVLDEEFGDTGAGLDDGGLDVDAEAADLAEEERGEGVAGVGIDGSGGREAGGEYIRELEVAGGAGRLEDVEGLEADVGSELETVVALDEGVVVEELGDGGGEGGVAAGGGAELLEADEVVGRQDIGERTGGDIGDLGGLGEGLAQPAGGAIELATGIAEAELIDGRRGDGEGVFGGEAVGAGEGVAETAAAVGQGSGGAGVVAEEGVAGEDAVAGAEVAVDAAIELIGQRVVVAYAAIVVGGRDVGGGVAIDDSQGSPVEARGGNGVAGESVSEPGSVDAAGGGGVEERGCEHAAALGGGGDGAGSDDPGVEAGALPVGEKEGPVFL